MQFVKCTIKVSHGIDLPRVSCVLLCKHNVIASVYLNKIISPCTFLQSKVYIHYAINYIRYSFAFSQRATLWFSFAFVL